ncbi:hypothetical protein L2E82_25671 [Cichorium intybus]|uniref:Uncharacterized protein n=1 Tax=Cichorium intybus TaxID=13427 RepID=A0ACB9E566_CICIN|nr:hypothetical protein L2E82_25671 [Cichorium intybus]
MFAIGNNLSSYLLSTVLFKLIVASASLMLNTAAITKTCVFFLIYIYASRFASFLIIVSSKNFLTSFFNSKDTHFVSLSKV